MTINKVLIVGGGIGGLCTAIALRRAGIAVELVEIQPQWRIYGVGIIQQNNVVREMQRLGVLERYLDAAWAFDRVSIHTQNGQPLATFPGERLAGAQFPANIGISRLALHQVLCSTAQELGAKITLGLSVKSFSQDACGVDVVFSDGASARYDLLVGADGIYSAVRGMLYGDRFTPRFTGQGVWRYNFPRPPEVDHLMCFVGDAFNCGLVPLADDLMYLFVTSCEPDNPRYALQERAAQMRRRMPACEGLLGELRQQIVCDESVVYKPLEELFVDAPWYDNRVVLIGDAVHATTPHLGQGAGMAIEDALVLAEELQHSPDVLHALPRFYQRRRARCERIWRDSLRVGESELQHDSTFDRQQVIRDMMLFTAQPV
ncbi:FAD-dependent oxidoreductase [Franconibacter helveticus]|uniref:FAD-dependent oxidoreductase n=1 Tax=Franconibacter helveticus TaxID=357240 RepID=UPI00066C6BA2|nr:FAD-dependent oxidoreductase [Franconibacter helveticus]MDU6923764.1 FAD-dependent oxidoreductase [Franconibacter helveticus]